MNCSGLNPSFWYMITASLFVAETCSVTSLEGRVYGKKIREG